MLSFASNHVFFCVDFGEPTVRFGRAELFQRRPGEKYLQKRLFFVVQHRTFGN